MAKTIHRIATNDISEINRVLSLIQQNLGTSTKRTVTAPNVPAGAMSSGGGGSTGTLPSSGESTAGSQNFSTINVFAVAYDSTTGDIEVDENGVARLVSGKLIY